MGSSSSSSEDLFNSSGELNLNNLYLIIIMSQKSALAVMSLVSPVVKVTTLGSKILVGW